MGHFSIYGGTITLQLPEQWDDHSVYTFVAPEQSLSGMLPTLAKTQGFRPNVVVTREAKGNYERLEPYVKDQLSASQKSLPQMKVIKEAAFTLADKPAIKRVFTFVVPNQNATVQQVQIFLMHEACFYTLTFSTLPSFFNEHEKMFDAMAAQVKFT